MGEIKDKYVRFIGDPKTYNTALKLEKGKEYPLDTVLDPAHNCTLFDLIEASKKDLQDGNIQVRNDAQEFLNDWYVCT